jgi:hypothetical protein
MGEGGELVSVCASPLVAFPNRPRPRRRPRRRLMIEDQSGARGWKKREGKEASGGSFAGTTGKQPRTRTIGDAQNRNKVHKRGVQTLKVDPQDESWSPAGHATVVLGRLPQRN